MPDFTIHFLLCNILLSMITGIFLTLRRLFRNILPPRTRYNLWFLLAGLLIVPFLPLPRSGFRQFFSLLKRLRYLPASSPESSAMITGLSDTAGAPGVNRIYDLALSVNRRTPLIGLILSCIWIAGMLVMLLFLIRSAQRLHTLKRSSLPLQNPEVRRSYQLCLREMGITRPLPIHGSAFLRSPVIAGFWKPCIYLPLHLISDCDPDSLRYMLLHELQHYKHKDVPAGFLCNMISVVYWFNPIILYALKEMRTDKEIACDTSVLQLLPETDHAGYGSTLIDLAEKISSSPFPFAAGISGNRKQIQQRILNIVSYKKFTGRQKLKSIAAFLLTVLVLSAFIPALSLRAADADHYRREPSPEDMVVEKDLSAYFGAYEGSFVLYSLKQDSWHIYNRERASLRVSPDSTYKIYDALFALEEGIITPAASSRTWNGETYPFAAWNTDQTLDSALTYSVNWYFQLLDHQLGTAAIDRYVQKIGYGNQDITGPLSSYWMESSLKISPVEQVELLTKLYTNDLGFAPENTAAVKNALRISSTENGTLYGKTGTGSINGRDRNGWFIGFVETKDDTCFFAVNITGDDRANGSSASDIALSLLSAEGILY